MAWTDEKKQEAIELYTKANPTPANSMEVVKEIAEQLEESPNGVRMILTKANVYIKKDATAEKATSTSSASTGAKRVVKADAIQELKGVISDAGADVSDEIIDKLTGKAANYFTAVIKAVSSSSN